MLPENPDAVAVIKEISRYTGINGKYYNETYLLRRINYRIERCGMSGISEYIAYLRKNAAEPRKLVDSIGVNVTAFFRDPDVYDVIGRRVLPRLIALKKETRSSRIRIWSTCCATGEEPYSLAIILRELLADSDKQYDTTIYATDIDEEALITAVLGRYRDEKMSMLGPALKERYFAPAREKGTYAVRDSVKRLVLFRKLDLISESPFNRMDMVVCRNMLIYVKRDRQLPIYEKLCAALDPGGYLVLGRSENPPASIMKRLEVYDVNERIYAPVRKTTAAAIILVRRS
jgi:chemotaxis methyl-accepting protein methylase